MADFHDLTVRSVDRQTPEAVAITLTVPDALRDAYTYVSGQYLNFKIEVDGETHHRSYSLCSSPYTGEDIQVAVKAIPEGTVSNHFNTELSAGDVLRVSEPMGNFTLEPDPDASNHYILFGGGSGITPLYSILKTVLLKEPNSRVTLFYGNHNGDSIIFLRGLTKLTVDHGNRFRLVHVFDQPRTKKGLFRSKSLETLDHEEGLMTKTAVLHLLKRYTDMDFTSTRFYLCGPSPMMKEVNMALNEIAIPDSRINQEYFTAKEDSEQEAAQVGDAGDGDFDGTATVHCHLDGEESSFSMNESSTVLDAALDNNVDAPFACMVGACTTCKAKLLEGSVHMDDSDALLPSEIEAGYVLTCQSHPRTSVIRIDYDA